MVIISDLTVQTQITMPNTLQEAHQTLINKNYPKALQLYTKLHHTQSHYPSKLILESLIATIHLHLCNYNQAHRLFNQLLNKIENYQNSDMLEDLLSIVTLKVKIWAHLIVLFLVGCEEERVREAQARIGQLLGRCFTGEQDQTYNQSTGTVLFKIVLKTIFGFDSFSQILSHSNLLLTQIHQYTKTKVQGPQSQKTSKQAYLPHSPTIYSSLSILRQLIDKNYEQSYNLQQIAFYLYKENKEYGMALISCKHLIHLRNKAGRSRFEGKDLLEEQMGKLMMCDSVRGIPQETLFRNYEEKIRISTQLTQKLLQKQKQYCQHNPVNLKWLEKVILSKLKTANTNHNEILPLITLIQNNPNNNQILQILSSTQFIKIIIQQYALRIQNLEQRIVRISNEKRREVLQRIREVASLKQIQIERVQYENKLKIENNVSQLNISPHRKPTKSKKQHATTLNIPYKQYQTQSPISEQNRQIQKTLNEHKSSIPSPVKQSSPYTNKVYFNSHLVENEHRQKVDVSSSNLDAYQLPAKNSIYKQKMVSHFHEEHQITPKKEKSKSSRIKIEEPARHTKQAKSLIQQFIKKQNAINQSNIIKKQPVKQQIKESFIPFLAQLNRITEIQEQQNLSTKNKPFIEKVQSPLLQSPTKIITHSKIEKSIKPKQNSIISKFSHDNSHLNNTHNTIKSKKQLQHRIKRALNLCLNGQYIQKRHFSSDGGSQRFLLLTKDETHLRWNQSQEKVLDGNYSQYPVRQIKGVLYGKASSTMAKQYNKKLQPWRCFSFVFKKRTFDVYCEEQKDIRFWIPGITYILNNNRFQYINSKYDVKISKKSQIKPANKVHRNETQVTTFYSEGRILWKRFLMRMQHKYLKSHKHKYNGYRNANAYAIIQAATSSLDYKLQSIKIKNLDQRQKLLRVKYS